MQKIIRSVVIVFISVAVGVGCGAAVAFAQEQGGAPPAPPPESSIQPAQRMEPALTSPIMQTEPAMGGGNINMPVPLNQPNAGPAPTGMPQQGEGWIMYKPQREFPQETKPYPSSEAEVRARAAEQMRGKIQVPYAQKGMQIQQGAPNSGGEFSPQGKPFEGGGFHPPSQGQGHPFMGGGEFQPTVQGGEGGFGGSWGPGVGGEGFDEAMMEEQQSRMEEQEKMMQKQQLQQMKSGFRRMESGLKQTQKIIDRLTKKGVAVPQEYVTLVSEITQAAATIKNAEEINESVEIAMEVLQEKGQELGEIGPRLGMMEQWPKTLKQAEKEIKKLNDALAKSKKKKGVSEYADIVAKVEAKVNDMNSRFSAIKAAGDSGDFEEAMGELQDFFENVGDTHREIGILGQLSNISKMIRSGEKEIASFEKQVKKVAKKGIDVSSVTALIADARAKIAKLKALAKNTEAEPEDFFEIMETLDEIRQRATDELNALQGLVSSQEGAVIRALIQLREGR